MLKNSLSRRPQDLAIIPTPFNFLTFPTIFKTSTVPLYKTALHKSTNNYRHITLNNVISKLLEKYVIEINGPLNKHDNHNCIDSSTPVINSSNNEKFD